jgi:tRNA-dihydrouridine synthase A
MGRGEDGAELPPLPPALPASTRWDRGDGGVDSHRLSVAPMLDCTNTHFRRLCRLVSRRTHLWTEMINQDAVIHSHATNPDLLSYGDEEHPLTVQLGGSSPERLARAAAVCEGEYGYDEINLNAGCPSAKVVAKPDADKCFGAILMRDPELVGECLRRMREAVDVPVTLKHRLGVRKSDKPDADASMDNYEYTSHFVQTVHELSGVDHFIVHARCAVLGGLSPTANRNVPPLRHDEVRRLAEDFPSLGFTLNGGVETVDEACAHLADGKLRGVMMGRAVYRNPIVLADVDRRVYGEASRANADADASAKEEKTPSTGFEPSTSRWGADAWSDGGDGRRPTSFFDLDASPLCVSRADVLRRYALYGDAAMRLRLEQLRRHPKALGFPRAVMKAAGGMAHGTRGGGSFRRAMDEQFKGWTERLLGGEEPEALSLASLAAAAAGSIGEWGGRDLRAPMTDPLPTSRDAGMVVKSWDAAERAREKEEAAAYYRSINE